MTKLNSATGNIRERPSTLGERLRFLVWLGELRLGTRTQQDFAEAVGKTASQLSSWIREDPRPAFESVKPIAERVGISALWLLDPLSRDATEPELWADWFRNGRAHAVSRPDADVRRATPAGVSKRARKPAADLADAPAVRKRRRGKP